MKERVKFLLNQKIYWKILGYVGNLLYFCYVIRFKHNQKYNNMAIIESKDINIGDFEIGNKIEVIGWIMLKGVEQGLYQITAIDDFPSITFSKINKHGKLTVKKLRFPTLSIIMKFGNANWKEMFGNGIRLIK